MSVNTYKRGQKLQLTEHFNISEFHCKGANCGCKETLHDPALSAYLQQIREHFGKPLKITSGYRCMEHNAAVGGAANSRHTKGQAADFIISGIKPLQIAQYAEEIGVKGIGLYDSFVHIDTRSTKFFWYSHQEEPRESFLTYPIYLLTCRIRNSAAIHTLIFDTQAGAQIQRIGNSSAAISLTLKNGNASFSTLSIGIDQAEILHTRKL